MVDASRAGRTSGWTELTAAAIALVAFALGVIGLETSPVSLGWPDVIYHSLQLFTFDSDALAGQKDINGFLQVARFLAPAAVLLAVALTVRNLLGSRWRARRISGLKNHVIVCGGSDSALALARDLSRRKKEVVLIGDTATPIASADELHVVSGDPREPATLEAAGIAGARALYACAEPSAYNAAVALAAGGLRTPRQARLETYAQVRSDDLVDALRVRRLRAPQPPDVTMDFFVVDDIAARQLVARYPVGTGTATLIGFGPLGRAVLRAIVRAPRATPDARTIFVRTVAPVAQVDAEAGRLDAAARGWTVRVGGREDDGDGLVYVCLADEDDAISTGLRLGRTGDRDVVVCLQRHSPFREALDTTARLQIFGVLDEACRESAIVEDSIMVRAARAIHDRYRREAAERGEDLGTNPSMAPWADLPAKLQDSNFAQAADIGTKLRRIRASLTTHPPNPHFGYRDDEVEQLARMEHERWMAERFAAGYRHGPRRNGMEHPDLVDWEYLSPAARKKDSDAVEYLPELLATEGLYIRRDVGT
jgi:TrkA-N domain